jgi:hypothetical protein
VTKFWITAGILATLVALGVSATASDDSKRGQSRVRARLHGFEENPSISSTGRGRFHAKIDDEARTIEYELTYSGIEGGTAFMAHIHFSARRVNGGVVAFLCGGGDKPACPATEGTVTGVIDAADIIGPADRGIEPGDFEEFVAAIRAGFTYANVHSTPRWPNGEIRGQIRGEDDDH